MSAKIRVCLISANSYPLFNKDCDAAFGGAELQIYLLAKYLAQDESLSVSVIVGDFGQEDHECRHNVTLVKAHRRNGKVFERLFAPFKLYSAISKIHPDVLIQRASGPETGICAFYASVKNIKFIYSVAHDAELVGESVASHHPLYRYLYDYGVNKAAKIVVQSQHQLQSLKRLNEELSDRAVVIPNSIEMKKSPPREREHILWVARAQSWKRPEVFFDLANAIRDEHFVMVMPVGRKTGESERLMKMARSIPNIEFVPGIDFNSSQLLFDKAKLLVNTSSWEGFPNTFLQAGLAGTPIVSLQVDPDSFIRNNGCGFACDNDFSVLLESVRHLLDSEDRWNEASKNCHEYVMKNHDIRINAEKWKGLINDSVD